jgi:Enoyl-(Acyl carrier protein) reductase
VTGGGDVSVSAAVTDMIAQVIAEYGRLDYAHNNAGIIEGQLSIHEYPDDQWHRIIANNLTSVFLCMKHEIPVMLAQAQHPGQRDRPRQRPHRDHRAGAGGHPAGDLGADRAGQPDRPAHRAIGDRRARRLALLRPGRPGQRHPGRRRHRLARGLAGLVASASNDSN